MSLNVLVVGTGFHRDFGFRSLRDAGHVVGVINNISHFAAEFVDWYHPFPAWTVDDPVEVASRAGLEWDVVLCWGESTLGDAQRFARALKVPTSIMDVDAFRDKAMMRDRLTKAGLRRPEYASVADPRAARAWAKRAGFPVVVKPADGTGSIGVRRVSSPTEVEEAAAVAIRNSYSARCVIEKELDGPEYSVESVSWGDGRVHTYGITAKQLGRHPFFVEHGHIHPASLSSIDSDGIVAEVHRALDAFGMTTGASHAEVIVTDEGPTIVEIAGRLGGDFIPRLVWEATGVNLFLEELNAVAGQTDGPSEATRADVSAVRFFDGVAGTVIDWPSSPDIIGTSVEGVFRDFKQWYPSGTPAPEVTNSTRRIGYCIVTGSREDVERSLPELDVLDPRGSR